MEENNEKLSKKKYHERIKERYEKVRNRHEGMRKRPERVIVKGYMRPDGTSYYVTIPKEVRELFELKGGEYFLIRSKPWKKEINLKIVKFVEEEEQP